MNLYKQMHDDQQERVNDFLNKYAFFAFSDEQLHEGYKKLKTDPESAPDDLVVLGRTGGFVLKERKDEFLQLLEDMRREQDEAIDDPVTGPQFAYDMFLYELNNHEYSYTLDRSETLDALGLTEEEVEDNPVLKKALRKACDDILAEAAEKIFDELNEEGQALVTEYAEELIEDGFVNVVATLECIEDDVYTQYNVNNFPADRRGALMILDMAKQIINEDLTGRITDDDLDELTEENFHAVRQAAVIARQLL